MNPIRLILLPLVLFACLPSARAQAKPGEFAQQVAGDLTLNGVLGVVGTSTGVWKDYTAKLESSADGFAGAFVNSDGLEIRTTFSLKQAGTTSEASLEWQSDAPAPASFFLLSYIVPSADLQDATLTSGKTSIDISKILSQTPTRRNLPDVSEFVLERPGHDPVRFSFGGPTQIEALLLGDNIYIRIFLTPDKEEVPSSGSARWTVGGE